MLSEKVPSPYITLNTAPVLHPVSYGELSLPLSSNEYDKGGVLGAYRNASAILY